MTLTVLETPLLGYKALSSKDLGRHSALFRPAEDDNRHTLNGTAEPGLHKGLSTLKGNK